MSGKHVALPSPVPKEVSESQEQQRIGAHVIGGKRSLLSIDSEIQLKEGRTSKHVFRREQGLLSADLWGDQTDGSARSSFLWSEDRLEGKDAFVEGYPRGRTLGAGGDSGTVVRGTRFLLWDGKGTDQGVLKEMKLSGSSNSNSSNVRLFPCLVLLAIVTCFEALRICS